MAGVDKQNVIFGGTFCTGLSISCVRPRIPSRISGATYGSMLANSAGNPSAVFFRSTDTKQKSSIPSSNLNGPFGLPCITRNTDNRVPLPPLLLIMLPKPHPPHSLLERVRWSRLLSWRPLCGLVASRRSSVTGFCPRRNEIADHDPFLVEHRPRDDSNWSSSKVSQYTSSESAWDGSAVAIEAFPSASLLIFLASRLPFCAHGVVAGGSAQSAAVNGVLERDTASHNTDLRVRPIRTKVM